MQYTSAQANKLLKTLKEERESILFREGNSDRFVAATVEDLDSARPDYNYAAVQARLEVLEGQIRTVKHAINAYNLTHTVEGFDMTVDQLLVYIPQLSEHCMKLSVMADMPPKKRYNGRNNFIEYEYLNYDPEQVRADYQAAKARLIQAQLALDALNQTQTMEIEL